MVNLWKHRDFRLVWASDTVSQFGTFVGNTVFPLIAVGALLATPFQVGVVTAAGSAAFLLIGLPAGAWVDRLRKRPLMIWADISRAVVLLTIPTAAVFDALTLTHLIAAALLVGFATVFYDVAAQSYLPGLVGRDALGDAYSKLQASASVAEMSGPPIAGGVVQLAGAANAMLVTGIGYLWSALFVSRVKTIEPVPPRSEQPHLLREIREGLTFVLTNRALRAIALSATSINFCHSIIAAVVVVFLVRVLGLSAGMTGVVLTASGVGALMGAITATRWQRRFGRVRVIWAAPLIVHPLGLLIPLATPGWGIALVAAGQAALAYAAVVFDCGQASLRQTITPDEYLGRMNASVRFIVWGSMPFGGLIGGALADWTGARTALWLATIGLLASAGWALASPLRTSRTIDDLRSVGSVTDSGR